MEWVRNGTVQQAVDFCDELTSRGAYLFPNVARRTYAMLKVRRDVALVSKRQNFMAYKRDWTVGSAVSSKNIPVTYQY